MNRNRKKKNNIVYLKRGDQIHKMDTTPARFFFSPPIIFTIVLIFVGALGSVVAAAHMADARREVTQARQARDAQLDANLTLISQMPQPFTIEEIEQIARDRLGMGRPDPSQIIYINVPPISHVVFNPHANILPDDTTFWEELRVFFTDIFNRVFGG
ncbi:MAG: hypothetical protein FWC71_08375 [Defluviitaleaceae bacterium]|nr:hypothetical protein [Defluviitaleaceae bacterium]